MYIHTGDGGLNVPELIHNCIYQLEHGNQWTGKKRTAKNKEIKKPYDEQKRGN